MLYASEEKSTTYVMIGSCVETWARSTDVLCGRWVEGMGSIAVGWDLDAADLRAWQAILCPGIWPPWVIRSSTLMVWVEWARGLVRLSFDRCC